MKLSHLLTALTYAAAAHAIASPTEVADKFVDALQHRHFQDAAAMFAPAAAGDTSTIAPTLGKIDTAVGGFTSMHAIAALPNGKSVKLQVPAPNIPSKTLKFAQVRYASTANDGQPVFYEVNLTDDKATARILSFDVHFPTTDASSSQRANKLVRLISQ